MTVTGKPLIEYLTDHPVYDDTVILPREKPLVDDASIAVLRGTPARAEVLLGRVQAPDVESLSVHRQKH